MINKIWRQRKLEKKLNSFKHVQKKKTFKNYNLKKEPTAMHCISFGLKVRQKVNIGGKPLTKRVVTENFKLSKLSNFLNVYSKYTLVQAENFKNSTRKTCAKNSIQLQLLTETMTPIKNHLFSSYAKFSEKLLFLIPWYAHLRVRISG